MTVMMTKTEAQDTLLNGPYVRSRIEKAIEALLPDRLRTIFDSDGPVYLVGNGADFRESTVPIAKELGTYLAGVACLWPHRMEFPRKGGGPAYSIPNECVETSLYDRPTVVFCQAIMAEANELLTLVNRIQYEVVPKKLIFSSALYNEGAADKVRDSLTIDAKFDGLGIGTSLEHQQRNVFDALDDRPLKHAPLMSRWLAKRIFGSDPKPRATMAYSPSSN